MTADGDKLKGLTMIDGLRADLYSEKWLGLSEQVFPD